LRDFLKVLKGLKAFAILFLKAELRASGVLFERLLEGLERFEGLRCIFESVTDKISSELY
jgi:hypothetical protein